MLDDLDQVLEIERQSFRSPWSPDMFVVEFSNPQSRRYVIREKRSGKILGYMIYWVVLDEGHLMSIATRADRLREGLGRRMMDRMIRECRKEGVRRLTLEVRRGNIPAIEMYLAYGFEAVGLRKNYYTAEREDAVLMELRIR